MKEFDDVQHRVYIEYIKCTVRYDECCSFFLLNLSFVIKTSIDS